MDSHAKAELLGVQFGLAVCHGTDATFGVFAVECLEAGQLFPTNAARRASNRCHARTRGK